MSDVNLLVTIDQPPIITISDDGDIILQVEAFQGIPGPAGSSIGGGGDVERTLKVAAANLSGHRAVVLNSDNTVSYASNDNLQHAGRILGVTVGAALIGTEATIQTRNLLIEPTWSWTPNQPVYLGLQGVLTQTEPTSGFLSVVGEALTATVLYVSIKESLILT